MLSECALCGVKGRTIEGIFSSEIDIVCFTEISSQLTKRSWYCCSCSSVMWRLHYLSNLLHKGENEIDRIVTDIKLLARSGKRIDVEDHLKTAVLVTTKLPLNNTRELDVQPSTNSQVGLGTNLPPKCYFCKKQQSCKRYHEAHVRTHTKEKLKQPLLWKCYFCFKRFLSRFCLQKHLPLHTREFTSYKCEECGKECFRKHNLKTHLIGVHGTDEEKRNLKWKRDRVQLAKPLDCYFCGLRLATNNNLITHMRSRHTMEFFPQKCNKCGTTFRNERCLKQHQERICIPTAKVLAKKALWTVKENCYFCAKFFTDKRQTERHIRFHTRENSAGRHKKGKSTFKPRFKLSCAQCGTTFRSLQLRQSHFHNEDGSAGYRCLKCSKSFVGKRSLQQHRDHCLRGLRCTVCGQRYFSRHAFDSHFHKKDGTPAFKCQECQQDFPKYIGLAQHKRSYCAKDPNRKAFCSICSISFRSFKKKYSHDNNVHSTGFVCYFCGMNYAQKRIRDDHLKKHTREAKTHPCGDCGRTYFTKYLANNHKCETKKGRNDFKCLGDAYARSRLH